MSFNNRQNKIPFRGTVDTGYQKNPYKWQPDYEYDTAHPAGIGYYEDAEVEPFNPDQDFESGKTIYDLVNMDNIAEILPFEILDSIGDRCVREYEADKASRSDWEKKTEDFQNLANLLKDDKSIPWEGCSNVKYPLIASAVMQFHARTFPNIIKDNMIARGKPVGRDEGGKLKALSDVIAEFISEWNVTRNEYWLEELDVLLVFLGLIGCEFRKTFHDPGIGGPVSERVSAHDLVIPYKAKSLEKAPRITHVYSLSMNELEEQIRIGAFLRADIGSGSTTEEENNPEHETNMLIDNTDDVQYTILEQHRWLDLDNDRYKEPYVVFVHKESGKVLRITPRYESKDIQISISNDGMPVISKIKAEQYFTRFIFMPSMDGGIYGRGLGEILMSGNHIINSAFDQIYDSGTQDILGGGFISDKLEFDRQRDIEILPNQWNVVQFDGENINHHVFPFPRNRDARVLFEILGWMTQEMKELSSNTDLMSGGEPGKNETATTTLARIEQGMQLYNVIFGRVHRALQKEFDKMYDIFSYSIVEPIPFGDGIAISRGMFNRNLVSIRPISDPKDTTNMEKRAKADALLQVAGLNPVTLKRWLEAYDFENYDEILGTLQQQPDPEMEIKKIELEIKRADTELKREELKMKAAETQLKMRHEENKLNIEAEKALSEIKQIQADIILKLATAEEKEAGIQMQQYQQNMQQLTLNDTLRNNATSRKVQTENLKQSERKMNMDAELKKESLKKPVAKKGK